VNEIVYYLIGILVLIVLDLVTVAARVGLLHTSLPRLLAQREESDGQVDRTIGVIQKLPRLQSSLNIARMILRFLIVGLIVYYLVRHPVAPQIPVLFGVLLAAAWVYFLLEWGIHSIVAQDTLRWALRLTTYARVVMFIFSPLVALPLLISGDTDVVPENSGPMIVTEDDLKVMVDAGQQEGVLEQEEGKMIQSIFELGDTLAREIMVPRIDVLALDVLTSVPEAVDALLQAGYSRVPVYEGTVDNIIGLLYAKDLLQVWREGEQRQPLRELLRPAYFVPEAKKVDELLAEMQSRRIHMAIVVDEYGGVAGLVTLEDIVEEILGEILDEYDEAEEPPYKALENGEYLFLGRIDLDDFNEIAQARLPKTEADTLGGFIYSRLGHVPATGELVKFDDLLLTVEQVSGRRIRRVHVTRVPMAEENLESADNDHR